MKRVLTVGGGPAGLYASLLLKKARPDLDVTLVHRDPRGATYGWGVVFSDVTLSEFREADPVTYRHITDAFVRWDAIDIHHRGELIRAGGMPFAGIARVQLLEILSARCEDLGVRLRFEEELTDPTELAGYDLVLAADGANSWVRAERGKVFGTRLAEGRSPYIWFGTDRVLDSFTFAFRETDEGLFQAHAYPFDGSTSTWIVETDEETWRRAGLDTATEAESIAFCERTFAEELRGARLMSNRSQWIRFVTVRNRTWRDGNVVLLGDAAHTAHFSIGSGTKLAMEDAIALARAIEQHEDLDAALRDYEAERRPAVERFQEAADESRTYFEQTRRYLNLEPMAFAFHLLTRSGRIDYGTLRARDPVYVDDVDRGFARASLVAPPPMLVPIRVSDLELGNRIVASPRPWPPAVEGELGEEHVLAVAEGAATGASIVLTPTVAVSAEGRITDGCAGLYSDAQVEGWRRAAAAAHAAGARLAIRLVHAGRRGATRWRDTGLDRPLAEGWPLLAPSPIPFSPRHRVPDEMTERDMEDVRRAYVEAASRAAAAGVDVVVIHAGHGYLLGSFLSTLSNARTDGYGGELYDRMRYPLEILEGIRDVWSGPLGVTAQASDAVRDGWSQDDAAHFVRAAIALGADLIEPAVGQITPRSRPRYGPGWLVPFADRIRNDAGGVTLVGGAISTTTQANTILAGGRADLVVLSR